MYKSLEQKENKKEEEIWRDIAGYEGLYQVSNMGRVKILERTVIRKDGFKRHLKERILKPLTRYDGYLQVQFYNINGKSKRIYIHRLVCEAFHENSENKPCVNHIDENKANNTASNLEWCTYKENNNHGTHNARMAKGVAKALCKPIGQYTQSGELVNVWQSTIEVKRQLGFDCGDISRAANNKLKTAYGYVWKFIEK